MIINCTSFVINLYNAADCNQLLHTYPASKNPVRATFVNKYVRSEDGTIAYKLFMKAVVNLPEPKPNTYYIVFKKIAKAFPERKDLLFPGTPKTVICDANGIVANVNCTSFSKIKD